MAKLRIDLIEKFMKDNNLTKEMFCKGCDISIATFDRIFDGDVNLHASTFVKIVTFINVGCDELLGLT